MTRILAGTILLLGVFSVQGHSLLAVEEEATEVARYWLPRKNDDSECRWMCDGDASHEDGPSGSDDYQCLGHLRVWCKDAPENATHRHLTGWSCQGVYDMLTWDEGDGGTHKAVATCEGGARRIYAEVTRCPHTGARNLSMMGSWSVGNSATLFSWSGNVSSSSSCGGVDDGGLGTARLQDPQTFRAIAEGMFKRLDKGGASVALQEATHRLRAAQIANSVFTDRTSDDDDDGDDDDDDDDDDDEWSLKIRKSVTGLSGEWRVKRYMAPDHDMVVDDDDDDDDSGDVSPSGHDSDSWEALDQAAQELLHPSWLDWLKGDAHGSFDPAPRKLTRNPPKQQRTQSVKDTGVWRLQCNGKQAWWHGKAPCWGNFTVEAMFTPTPSDAARSTLTASAQHQQGSNHAATYASRRALLVSGHQQQQGVSIFHMDTGSMHLTMAPTAKQSLQVDRNTATANNMVTEDTTRRYMRAECDGLWTGALGMTCHGVSTSHVKIEKGGCSCDDDHCDCNDCDCGDGDDGDCECGKGVDRDCDGKKSKSDDCGSKDCDCKHCRCGKDCDCDEKKSKSDDCGSKDCDCKHCRCGKDCDCDEKKSKSDDCGSKDCDCKHCRCGKDCECGDKARSLARAQGDMIKGNEAHHHVMNKWSVCSGHKSVSHVHKKDGWAIETACKGASTMVLRLGHAGDSSSLRKRRAVA